MAKDAVKRWTSLFAWVLGSVPSLAALPAPVQPVPADLLLLNGRVYTLSWSEPSPEGTPAGNAPNSASGWRPDAEAVAIRGDRIVFVGGTREAQAYRGPRTRVLDVAGPPSCPASSTPTPTWPDSAKRPARWT